MRVISVHSPETEWEKERANVEKGAKQFGLTQPIYLDTDFSFWNALGNRYWPSFYLVDKQGKIRLRKVGEMHAGGGNAAELEQMVQQLLNEK